MHSSRMRTGLIDRMPGGGGAVCSGGCVCSQGGVCSGGVCSRGGVLGEGGVLVSQLALRQTPPPPVDRITDACKNITLTQFRCGR